MCTQWEEWRIGTRRSSTLVGEEGMSRTSPRKRDTTRKSFGRAPDAWDAPRS